MVERVVLFEAAERVTVFAALNSTETAVIEMYNLSLLFLPRQINIEFVYFFILLHVFLVNFFFNHTYRGGRTKYFADEAHGVEGGGGGRQQEGGSALRTF